MTTHRRTTGHRRNTGLAEESQDFEHKSAAPNAASFSTPVKAVIGEGGRLVIPAEMRKLMGIKPGDTVSLRMDDGALRVVSAKMALRRVQEIARKLKEPGESVVDEFLAERRQEQQRSDERFDRLEREAAQIAKGEKR